MFEEAAFSRLKRSVSIIRLPTTAMRASGTPSASRLTRPLSSVTSRRSAIASVTRRLISSGMVRSKLRRPASICTSGTFSFAATSAQATVELTSPDHYNAVGLLGKQNRFEAHHDGRGLPGVGAGAYRHEVVGRRDFEVAEELAGHDIVIVLAGVNEDGFEKPVAHGSNQRGDLHEIGSRAGDADEADGFQGLSLTAGGQTPVTRATCFFLAPLTY